jgi:uncharacterized protein with HEPN domain
MSEVEEKLVKVHAAIKDARHVRHEEWLDAVGTALVHMGEAVHRVAEEIESKHQSSPG